MILIGVTGSYSDKRYGTWFVEQLSGADTIFGKDVVNDAEAMSQ